MTEELILRVIRAREGLFFKDQGLMTKEIAEQAGLSTRDAEGVLRDMADRGLVHRSSFFWYSGSAPAPGSRSELNRAPRDE